MPWPEQEFYEKIFLIFKKDGPVRAQIILDLNRIKNKLDDENYYLLKTGIISTNFNNYVLFDYVKNDLELHKQDKIITTWINLFKNTDSDKDIDENKEDKDINNN